MSRFSAETVEKEIERKRCATALRNQKRTLAAELRTTELLRLNAALFDSATDGGIHVVWFDLESSLKRRLQNSGYSVFTIRKKDLDRVERANEKIDEKVLRLNTAIMEAMTTIEKDAGQDGEKWALLDSLKEHHWNTIATYEASKEIGGSFGSLLLRVDRLRRHLSQLTDIQSPIESLEDDLQTKLTINWAEHDAATEASVITWKDVGEPMSLVDVDEFLVDNAYLTAWLCRSPGQVFLEAVVHLIKIGVGKSGQQARIQLVELETRPRLAETDLAAPSLSGTKVILGCLGYIVTEATSTRDSATLLVSLGSRSEQERFRERCFLDRAKRAEKREVPITKIGIERYAMNAAHTLQIAGDPMEIAPGMGFTLSCPKCCAITKSLQKHNQCPNCDYDGLLTVALWHID